MEIRGFAMWLRLNGPADLRTPFTGKLQFDALDHTSG